jgi:predicted transcriptional regulator
MPWQVNEVQRHLKGADYPMTGAQLAELAKKNGADQALVDELAQIKGEVGGPNGVMKELKGELGGRTPGPHVSEEHDYKDVEGPNFQVNEVQKFLKGADYPMNGEQLSALAKKNGAREELVEVLKEVGEVNGPNAVMHELKEHIGGKPSAPGD